VAALVGFSWHRDRGYVLVTLGGVVDVAVKQQIGLAFAFVVHSGLPLAVVDLTPVRHFSAAGLRCLELLEAAMTKAGGRVHLVCAPDGAARTVLQAAGRAGSWPISEDVAHAVRALDQPPYADRLMAAAQVSADR
jgi:anti-anti-sigma regulatory factor